MLTVCRTAFYYRDDLKSLMLGAGVSAAVYNRYDHPEIATVRIARTRTVPEREARGYELESLLAEADPSSSGQRDKAYPRS